jgi:hypothetical protein
MGTSTPTADQITRIREDLAAVQANYTDPQITTLWASAVDALDEITQHEATLYLMVKREIGRAINSIDYAAGNTSEKLSQKIGNLKVLLSIYQAAHDRVFDTGVGLESGVMLLSWDTPEVIDEDAE